MSGFASDLGRHGARPALILHDGSTVSYADLAVRVAACAAGLPRRRILLALEAAPHIGSIVAYLAALDRGTPVALLPPGDPAAWDGFRSRFRPELTCTAAGGWRLAAEAGPGGPLGDDLALLLITSGSTGQGKAVRLAGSGVQANPAAIGTYLGLRSDDRAALVLPLHYSYGLSVLNAHLAAGASLWLPQGGVLADGFLDSLRAARCTNLAGVPHSYELLESIGFRDAPLPDLRLMTVAGGRLAPALVLRYHLARRGGRFFVMYGQTEATARIACLPPELAGRFPDRIGVAIPGGTLSLIDDAGHEITRPEVAGEMVYRGPNVMLGYATDRADLARGREVDALRIGDLAIRDRHGLYRIVGRRQRMSKIAGRRLGHDAPAAVTPRRRAGGAAAAPACERQAGPGRA